MEGSYGTTSLDTVITLLSVFVVADYGLRLYRVCILHVVNRYFAVLFTDAGSETMDLAFPVASPKGGKL